MRVLLFKPAKAWLVACLASVLGLAAISGCQPVFMSQDSYTNAHAPWAQRSLTNEESAMTPNPNMTPAPATVINPDRPPRYMTLQEAMAIALENGSVSSRSGFGTGIPNN